MKKNIRRNSGGSKMLRRRKLLELAQRLATLERRRLREDSHRDTDIVSDIQDTWIDPIEIRQDIREYLMNLRDDGLDDYEIEDRIDAIEAGISEYNKIVKM